jgi:hypothetical protein
VRLTKNGVFRDFLKNGNSQLPQKQITVLGGTEISHEKVGKT